MGATLLGVGTAWASPPANTISETDLQTLLQAGPVTGYFETVLGGATAASQQPVQIPVTVQSIVPNAGPAGDLILFEANGPAINAIGGIAVGMSGSPLYVDDGSNTAKLAGAVSYGDFFTTNNLGLATPIADMMVIETTYFPQLGLSAPLGLRAPVITPTGVVSKIVLARNAAAAAAAALRPAAGTSVMAPLTTLQVNGLIPGSPVYKRLAAKLAALGFDMTPTSAGSYQGDAQLPALDAGSSLGVMYSTGDFAAGALGTVTYVDPANSLVVAFGHPFDYTGTTNLDLTSAWVQGIWSSTYEPFKVMSPVATLGAITQDRGAGVAGLLGLAPVQVPITSQATLDGVTKTSASSATQWVVDKPNLAGLPSAAAAVAMQRVTDAGAFPGSATSAVTINVTDGSNEYQVKRTDLWNDTFDVMSVATGDIDNALWTLTAGLPGVSAQVESVDFSTTLSATDRSATIEDVTVPGGLKVGTNHLTVSLLTSAGQTVGVPATLVIPRGTLPSGTLEVFAAAGFSDGSPPGATGALGASLLHSGLATSSPATLADLVDAINQAPKNTDLDIVFTPANQGAVVQPVEVLADTTDWFVEGDVQKSTGQLQVMVPRLVGYRKPVPLFGTIGEADATTNVRVYERPAGQNADKLVATLTATLANDSTASFETMLGGLTKTTLLTCIWDGDADHLAATARSRIAVRAHVLLSASVAGVAGRPAVHLTVHISPEQTSGVVFIFRRVGHHWVHLMSLSAKAPIVGQWRPAPGTYQLRAVFEGSPSNASAASKALTVSVR